MESIMDRFLFIPFNQLTVQFFSIEKKINASEELRPPDGQLYPLLLDVHMFHHRMLRTAAAADI